jgi:hypothetical protein
MSEELAEISEMMGQQMETIKENALKVVKGKAPWGFPLEKSVEESLERAARFCTWGRVTGRWSSKEPLWSNPPRMCGDFPVRKVSESNIGNEAQQLLHRAIGLDYREHEIRVLALFLKGIDFNTGWVKNVEEVARNLDNVNANERSAVVGLDDNHIESLRSMAKFLRKAEAALYPKTEATFDTPAVDLETDRVVVQDSPHAAENWMLKSMLRKVEWSGTRGRNMGDVRTCLFCGNSQEEDHTSDCEWKKRMDLWADCTEDVGEMIDELHLRLNDISGYVHILEGEDFEKFKLALFKLADRLMRRVG